MKNSPNALSGDFPLSRRAALSALVGFGAAAVLVACGSDTQSSSASSATTDSAADSTAATTGSSTAATTGSTSAATTPGSGTAAAPSGATDPIPEETGGPYPGDGSNGPNILTQDGVVRSDIRTSIGSASGTAEGVPLTIELTVTDASTGSAMPDAAIYLWHCTRDGAYSMYNGSAQNENYLRGVQSADSNGKISFTSIFPAAYSGRWPHIHFEVYSSVDDATGGGSPIVTSQIALPEDICDEVYATDGYSASVRNLAQTSLDTDMVFSDDGGVHELATVTGTVSGGLVAALAVPV